MFGRDKISVTGQIGGTTFSYNNGNMGVNTTFGTIPTSNYTFHNYANNFNSGIQTVNSNDSIVKTELLNGIYNNILIVNENKDLLGRLSFIMNTNLFHARKAEVIEIINKLVDTSAKYTLNISANGYDGDGLIMGLANRINQGLQMDAANLGIDWRVYSNPLTGSNALDNVVGHPFNINTNVTNTQSDKPIAQTLISGSAPANHSAKINDAIAKLRKLVTDLGFTDMDNPKKLKKFWDSNFVPKYKKYADIPFSDILAALQ